MQHTSILQESIGVVPAQAHWRQLKDSCVDKCRQNLMRRRNVIPAKAESRFFEDLLDPGWGLLRTSIRAGVTGYGSFAGALACSVNVEWSPEQGCFSSSAVYSPGLLRLITRRVSAGLRIDTSPVKAYRPLPEPIFHSSHTCQTGAGDVDVRPLRCCLAPDQPFERPQIAPQQLYPAARCPKCGGFLQAEFRYCPQCGSRV